MITYKEFQNKSISMFKEMDLIDSYNHSLSCYFEKDLKTLDSEILGFYDDQTKRISIIMPVYTIIIKNNEFKLDGVNYDLLTDTVNVKFKSVIENKFDVFISLCPECKLDGSREYYMCIYCFSKDNDCYKSRKKADTILSFIKQENMITLDNTFIKLDYVILKLEPSALQLEMYEK
ncbi:hypothetical protein [Veillonella sp.]|jgi:hypothetical protein|uniref:hypothetical protein n=1 Tax=Veillonella sp. TaxID=1926307 RepID=UPI0029111B3A|nr:hypothetical protein [Veillonella sp.]MDU6631828.1 hypothetical protein [Veillonella sp.]